MKSLRRRGLPSEPDAASPAAAAAPAPDGRTRARHDIVCYRCSSTDTMEPFSRRSEIWLVSRLLPFVRRRYCRSCGRHFLSLRG
jgi:hypothetical protein